MTNDITIREITPLEEIAHMDEGGQVFALEQNIIRTIQNIQREFLAMGEWLIYVHDNELWDKDNYDSFSQYLAQPKINMGKSTAYDFMRINRSYVVDGDVDKGLLCEVGSVKLKLLLEKNAVSDENVIDQLHMAKELSKRDLMSELGVITLNESGYIEAQLKKDEAGHYLHIHHGDESLPPGIYRLTEMESAFGEADVVCHFKGKIQ